MAWSTQRGCADSDGLWAGYNNTLYSLSMPRNFRRRYITDFGRVEGVPGVYMANQLSPDIMADPTSKKSIDYEKFIQSKVLSPLAYLPTLWNLSSVCLACLHARHTYSLTWPLQPLAQCSDFGSPTCRSTPRQLAMAYGFLCIMMCFQLTYC